MSHSSEHQHVTTRKNPRVLVLGATVILLVAGLLAGHHLLKNDSLAPTFVTLKSTMPNPAPDLRSINSDTVDDLLQAFENENFTWPPETPVPAIAASHFPDDISDRSVAIRKSVFFRTLLPLILAENTRLLEKRRMLVEAFASGDLKPDHVHYPLIVDIANRYAINGDLNTPEVRAQLLRRVDSLPASLALAQAAYESGWGTSRFTQEANNLFGVRTWEEDAGLIPQQRAEGATHRIRLFPNLQASVRNYLFTLNIGNVYSDLRRLRATMRQQGDELNGLELTSGLSGYSERGEAYVEEVRSMIRSNNLDELGQPLLNTTDSD